jgi:ATP-dependent RNA helicase RhlE
MSFHKLSLITPLLSSLEREGYRTPTPVQNQSIPAVLDGRDLLACAQTGTGKTAAFALPILQKLSGTKSVYTPGCTRALVLTPTRELAVQIGESFATYGRSLNLRLAVVYGGVGYFPQKNKLKNGIDILVATPGRLLDLIEQKSIKLHRTEIFTLDEADRMLDMGFIRDVRKIAAFLPRERQTLLFSATMPEEIRSLADSLLSNPHRVQVSPQSTTADNIDQSVYFVEQSGKAALLGHLLADESLNRVLIFSRTKHGADRICRGLERQGIQAESIHGNKSQNARQRSLDKFRKGSARVLVATDIASRGIDIDSISHVINYELPEVPETYIHRIGRTARAGASGTSVSFCDAQERYFLRDIERLIKQRIPIKETPYVVETTPRTNSHPAERNGREYSNRQVPSEKEILAKEDSKPFYTPDRKPGAGPRGNSFRKSRSGRRSWR